MKHCITSPLVFSYVSLLLVVAVAQNPGLFTQPFTYDLLSQTDADPNTLMGGSMLQGDNVYVSNSISTLVGVDSSNIYTSPPVLYMFNISAISDPAFTPLDMYE